MKTKAPELITVQQAATALKISPQRVRVLLNRYRLEGYRKYLSAKKYVWGVSPELKVWPAKNGRPAKRRKGVSHAA